MDSSMSHPIRHQTEHTSIIVREGERKAIITPYALTQMKNGTLFQWIPVLLAKKYDGRYPEKWNTAGLSLWPKYRDPLFVLEAALELWDEDIMVVWRRLAERGMIGYGRKL